MTRSMDGRPGDGRQWLASYQRKLTHLRAQAHRAEAEIAVVEATVASPDGAVTVTAAPGGAVRRMMLSEQSESLSRSQLAALVVETVTRAQAAAAARATEALAPLLGERSEAMRVLREQGVAT